MVIIVIGVYSHVENINRCQRMKVLVDVCSEWAVGMKGNTILNFDS